MAQGWSGQCLMEMSRLSAPCPARRALGSGLRAPGCRLQAPGSRLQAPAAGSRLQAAGCSPPERARPQNLEPAAAFPRPGRPEPDECAPAPTPPPPPPPQLRRCLFRPPKLSWGLRPVSLPITITAFEQTFIADRAGSLWDIY
ncbi:hypothetical protein VULLAG_LOCUS23593 [Vulpes lagopus]